MVFMPPELALTVEHLPAIALPAPPDRTEVDHLAAPAPTLLRALPVQRTRRDVRPMAAAPDQSPAPFPAPAKPADAKPASPAPPSPEALAALEGRIHAAVQASLVYPPSARLMRRQGRARIRFDYHDGTADAASVTQSSRSALLDRAALDAVGRAAMPRPPVDMGARRLTLQVWVDFTLGEQE